MLQTVEGALRGLFGGNGGHVIIRRPVRVNRRHGKNVKIAGGHGHNGGGLGIGVNANVNVNV